jgi:hypothetical protein
VQRKKAHVWNFGSRSPCRSDGPVRARCDADRREEDDLTSARRVHNNKAVARRIFWVSGMVKLQNWTIALYL